MSKQEEVNTLESRAAVQDLDKMEKWGNGQLMKFSIGRWKVLHLI